MAAKPRPEAVDGMLDESLLGVLLILLVVLLSTGYVYIQQLRAGANANANSNNLNNNNQQRGAAQIVGRAAPGAPSAPVRVVATAGLSDRQAKLHAALPVRYGARTLTVSGAALLDRKTSGALAWAGEGVAALLKDLARVADVYVLCALVAGADADAQKREMQQLRAFLAEDEELKGAVKPHKVLFCSTTVGEIAFVRQLEPQVHIEGRWAFLVVGAIWNLTSW